MRKAKPIEWVTNEKGCHLVTSLKQHNNGYINVTRNQKNWLLHRYIYTQVHGEIPKDLVILHTCDEPTCINIEHLRTGTQKDNITDMIDKGRKWTKPSKYDSITPKRITELRNKRGLSGEELARRSGISGSYLARVEKHHYNGSIDVLNRIAKALNVSFTELFK